MTQVQDLTATCPTCQATNAPSVKFCAQCGTRLAVAAEPAAAPVAARPAAPPVAPAHTAAPVATPPDALAHARAVLAQVEATITSDDGQSTIAFVMPESSVRFRGPLPTYFSGTITAAPSGPTRYVVTAQMLPKSMAVVAGFWLAGIVIAGMLPRALMSNDTLIGSIALSIPVVIWVVLSLSPKRQRRHLEKLLGGEVAPSPATATAPAPVAVTPSAPAGGDVFAQLERLAQLQATGLLTAEDVATKKAELLKRI